MTRLPLSAAALFVLSTAAFAQTIRESTPSNPELQACKATALIALTQRDSAIKDIFIDEDGLTIASADTKVEDTPVKPRRFLCLVGEKGKVLLTFFTQN
jgi:hypothetical protein